MLETERVNISIHS